MIGWPRRGARSRPSLGFGGGESHPSPAKFLVDRALVEKAEQARPASTFLTMTTDMEHPRPAQWRALMKIGDVGLDVAAWRLVLALDGYDLNGLSNHFESTTHNATVAWQKARGIKPDGVVGPVARVSINAPTLARPAPAFDAAAIPFIEAKNWSRNVGPQPKTVIVLHTMEYPETSTTAEWCARFFAGLEGAAPQASAHYCVDDDSIVGCVPPDRIAWHAPGANTGGIGIEHAGYARQSRAQWLDDYSLRMLQLSAALTAHLCRRFAIPCSFIVAEHLRRGGRGITTHAEVTKAFGKSTHTDPGPFFPLGDYLRMVVEAMQRQHG